MAHQVVWLEPALADLEEIAAYIARDSDAYAASVVRTMLDRAADLAQYPRMGHVVPEVGDDTVRETQVYSYRLVYRVFRDTVTILAVLHGARRFPGDIPGRG